MENPLPNHPQDLKIYQAAGYDADKVKAIRELMEEEAYNFTKWCVDNNKIALLSDWQQAFMENKATLISEYQQSKQPKP